ncbi:MAG: radical SAM protein [Motiliproteus sp.]
MSNYRLTANIEWTSKCNAKCAMCPRHVIDNPKLMTTDIFDQMMSRLNSGDLVRAIIAGYGEPTTHPKFMEFTDKVREHPVQFDMVTNGERFDEDKIRHVDGAMGMVMMSFSSIDKDIYQKVHTNLDQQRVMDNIVKANQLLKKTKLSVSLTPMQECLDTLPETIEWFHDKGITDLRMSPNFYNRAGNIEQLKDQTRTLRGIIDRYNLKALDMDFVPGAMDVVRQLKANRFKCIPRNTTMFITSHGDYLYCYNDMAHGHSLGNVTDISLRGAVEVRENMAEKGDLCTECNMRGRYKGVELVNVAAKYFKSQLIAQAS